MIKSLKILNFTFTTFASICLLILVSCGGEEAKGPIWTGPDKFFFRATSVDWTLAENQDKITDAISLTRQNKGPVYNYTFWRDLLGSDATFDSLYDNFWGSNADLPFTPNGGTQGLRWAILNDEGSNGDWPADFDLYGTLGDPTNYYSLHNIASMLPKLNDGVNVVEVVDDFNILDSNGATASGTVMTDLVGHTLGVYIPEREEYFTLKFEIWGTGETGNQGAVAWTRSTR